MVEGPEVNPLLAPYEAMSSSIDTRIDRRHHEATVGAQTALFVKVMTTVLQDMGNPFQNESSGKPQSCTVGRYPPSERIEAGRCVPRWSSQRRRYVRNHS